MTATNDSAELEALFDSIAADMPAPAPAAAPAPAPAKAAAKDASGTGDSADLEALFDSVATQYQPAAEEEPKAAAEAASSATESGATWPAQETVFNSIGHMARLLHDTLHQLGYDKLLEKTASALPDAKDRLAYVANLTEQAACRVLNATDVANPLVEEMECEAKTLAQRWDKVFANQLNVEEFKQLATETRGFLKEGLPQRTQATRAQLTEIMMAQDFQDLTGQVIKKIVTLAQDLESGLMNVLIEVMPDTRRTDEVNSLMNGPVVSAEGRADVVVNQQQVDDLLDSLGF